MSAPETRESAVAKELEQIRSTQRAASRVLLGIVSGILLAAVLTGATVVVKVERIDAYVLSLREDVAGIRDALKERDTTMLNRIIGLESRVLYLERLPRPNP